MDRPGLALLLTATLFAACGSSSVDDDAYEAAVMAWRDDRAATLAGPDGFLNLAGLFWLSTGQYSFGGGSGADLRFPGTATDTIGHFVVDGEGITMRIEPGVDVRYEGVPVRTLFLSDDTTVEPITVTHGSLAWTAIRRDDRMAIRLRDYAHPALEAFEPLPYFTVDARYRVAAVLQPFDEPRVLDVGTVVPGLDYRPSSPGRVEFELGGEQYALDAYLSGDRLFLVFGDRTNGRETYPAGRFMYAPLPDEHGRTVLDFNLAYSPPCAFNDFATCPIAAPDNRLPVRIEAGERFDKKQFFEP